MPSHAMPVSDLLSNYNDQRVTAAELIGRSKHRQDIFKQVYRGQKRIKTIEEISDALGISTIHVLTEGGKMAGLLFEKVRGGYKKKPEFAARYQEILRLAKNPQKRRAIATKTSPNFTGRGASFKVSFPRIAQGARFVTIDDIESFAKASKLVNSRVENNVKDLAEKKIKEGFTKIIGESGSFKDWGGEKSDLYTTRLRYRGARRRAAVAFKGKATTGKLVPAKMGKNGDQVNRLFEEPAEIFLVVFGGQIDPTIVSQMQAFALGRAMSGARVYYGVVDGTDLARIVAAYPKAF